jgi:PhnB protein
MVFVRAVASYVKTETSTVAHTPAGFHTVTPYFLVKDADLFVEFLIEGLEGSELFRHLRPDGKIANAQVRLGSSTVMVSEASAQLAPMSASYYLYVSDADRSVKQALAHGATLIMKVADMPYGDRQGGVRDRHGNIWWVSQRLTDQPYSP